MPSKYVHLKEAIAKAEKQHGLYEIDPSTREILQTIASANLSDTKICVSDTKNEQVFGTLPTVLARLQKLVEAGWIERRADPDDGRVVLLRLTFKAKSIFKKISKAI
jgi:DNA-binding MarR family transcriptional regulator